MFELEEISIPSVVKCGHEMKVITLITNSHEVSKILECLKTNHALPFYKVEIKTS